MVAVSTRVRGTAFVAGRACWPEIATLRLARGVAEIVLFVSEPEADLISTVADGVIHWGWVGSSQGSLLGMEFSSAGDVGSLPRQLIVYHARQDVHDGIGPHLEHLSPRLPVRARVVLVEAASGIISAVSEHDWPAEVGQVIRAGVAAQLALLAPPASPALAMSQLLDSYGGAAAVARLFSETGVTWTTGPA